METTNIIMLDQSEVVAMVYTTLRVNIKDTLNWLLSSSLFYYELKSLHVMVVLYVQHLALEFKFSQVITSEYEASLDCCVCPILTHFQRLQSCLSD
jgi:hypothetical protein